MRKTMILGELLDSLFEHAYQRRVVVDQIRALAEQVVFHLIKVLKWDVSDDFRKHVSDISAWLFSVQRKKVKGNRQRLKGVEYFELLYVEPIGDDVGLVRDIIRRELKSYHGNPVLRSDEEVMREMHRILKLVSGDISKNKFEGVGGYFK